MAALHPAVIPLFAQGEGHQLRKAQAVGPRVPAAKGQEPRAGAPFQEGLLVARQMRLREVMTQTRAQGSFIADVLDVHLGQGEGLLRLPSPVGWVANLALAPGMN